MEPAIPWYRSPVYVGALTSILSQAMVLFGLSDLISAEQVGMIVNGGLELVALIAAVIALIARHRSQIQPITATKAGAAKANGAASSGSSAQLHPLTVLLGIALTFVMLSGLAGCATSAYRQAETLEQRAAALIGDFNIWQRAALKIAEDTTVLPTVRREVADAVIAAKPVVDDLDAALRQYRSIARALDAGETTEDKVAIAAANLNRWILDVAPLITHLRTSIEGARSP